MKFHIFSFLLAIILFSSVLTVTAQVDSVIGQVTSAAPNSFAGGISGDGRFIVFESTGDLATFRDENNQPNNIDGNNEIFLFDYAQRRIFQITNTKSLLTNAANSPTFDNVKVNIVNTHPVISFQPDANGNYWIAFSSNATCNYPGNGTTNPPIVSTTGPAFFDPNATSGNPCLVGSGTNQTNNLVNDGNTELYLYRVPTVTPVADLSEGEEIALTNLAGGQFTQVTNTLPSRLPVAGSTTSFPIIADDNRDIAIDDTGAGLSFTSNRDLVTGGNTGSTNGNDEIFFYLPGAAVPIKQITTTPRGTVASPIYNANSTIANLGGGGWRIAFLSNGNNPIVGMTGSNADQNEEIFFVDLLPDGSFGANKKQVTTTARTNPGDVVNIFNYGKRMSRDGRYIAFDSFADLEGNAANQPGFATFVYDTTLTTNAFRRIMARSDADSAASGGDIARYPTFTTDLDSNLVPQTTLVFETRMNIRAADGTIPTTASEGLNNIPERPAQVYQYLLNVSTGAQAARFVRLTKLPTPSFFLFSIQPLTTATVKRMAFNLGRTDFGTGNPDLGTEVFYLIKPNAVAQSAAALNFSTGASRIPVSASPVPTPTATPTPSPTPTPTTTPSPTPTPTPQSPPAVQGVSPGMLAILDYDSGVNQPLVARTAVGALDRRFTLPIELSGLTMTINGAAVGLKSVGRRQITFVVPPGLVSAPTGTVYPVVINNNGFVFKGNVTIVPARPDIFTNLPTPGPGGRARIFNATNRVLLTEPFPIRTFRLRGSRLVPTVLRVYVTGVERLTANQITIRIGSVDNIPATTAATLVEPGVYTVDFNIPATLAGAGDKPIIIRVNVGGTIFESRLDDTAPRLTIL